MRCLGNVPVLWMVERCSVCVPAHGQSRLLKRRKQASEKLPRILPSYYIAILNLLRERRSQRSWIKLIKTSRYYCVPKGTLSRCFCLFHLWTCLFINCLFVNENIEIHVFWNRVAMNCTKQDEGEGGRVNLTTGNFSSGWPNDGDHNLVPRDFLRPPPWRRKALGTKLGEPVKLHEGITALTLISVYLYSCEISERFSK